MQLEFSKIRFPRSTLNRLPHTLDTLLGVRWDLAASPLSHRLVTSLILRWEEFVFLENINIYSSCLRVTLKHELLVKVEAVTMEVKTLKVDKS